MAATYGLCVGSRSGRACGDQDACNPNTKRHEPGERCNRVECDPAIAAFKHRTRRTPRKRGQAQHSSTPCAKSAGGRPLMAALRWQAVVMVGQCRRRCDAHEQRGDCITVVVPTDGDVRDCRFIHETREQHGIVRRQRAGPLPALGRARRLAKRIAPADFGRGAHTSHKFAADSPLERAGFELSVPRERSFGFI
jgi:hypothetical protein